ncbi:MAG: cation diffusion facilitator family transporter [Frisingicoccus sp.]|uniref:cation diffusion facilitator family transporter n=1 Tax=Frisingicoccus sp. TaxID=1918627 RepID=UPI0026125D01|nr:cation diffusion facilitator family transporter [Frisingicoccus sp.]MDD6232841.1 cation diffusion facilitator family transporter [Frisingicoccus sp.]MDY4835638.1 cation diffusion facilitator family transporter [Frisingicoccus sp.]
MNLLCRLLRQDLDTREGIISVTSGLGIIVNVILAVIKVIVGMMTSSIAIVSEGANGAADAMSSLLALVGAKLAGKHPDEKHPFGYGRIEYLVSLIISVLILITGSEMLTSSVKLIFNPEELSVSYLAIGIVACSAVIKFFLGVYTIKMGKKADSNALIGVGLESRNDAFASVITIVSSLIFLIFHVSIDAYAGILISLLIIKAGVEVLRETVSDLLGRPGEHELAIQLYKEIRETDGILSAADMMLHNYGPGSWSGSVNVEIDHRKTVGEIYQFLHELQLRIMHEHHVTMVFGVYAVDNEHPELKELRKRLRDFVKEHDSVKSYHAVYIDTKKKIIYCDMIVSYSLKNWDGLKKEFRDYICGFYPEYGVDLTVETEFV